jgi:hypothetical protein
MYFEIYGPFAVPKLREAARPQDLNLFWTAVEDADEGLSWSIGVYVFSTVHGETLTPWYVGKTSANRGFRGELFQDHKISHYVSARQLKKGMPVLHLVSRIHPVRGTFSRRSDRAQREIDLLETAVIAMALKANPYVRNSKKTWFNRTCHVPGLLGQPSRGRRPASVASLRRALQL